MGMKRTNGGPCSLDGPTLPGLWSVLAGWMIPEKPMTPTMTRQAQMLKSGKTRMQGTRQARAAPKGEIRFKRREDRNEKDFSGNKSVVHVSACHGCCDNRAQRLFFTNRNRAGCELCGR